jgi:antirestriction protein ArdC
MRNDIAEEITNKFIAALSEGKIPWQMPWHCLSARNVTNGKAYRGVNVLLTSMAESNWFLTFNQAKANGGYVKAGSKSIPIVFFSPITKTDKNGRPVLKDDGKEDKFMMLRYYRVFRFEDCEGKGAKWEALKARVAKALPTIEFTPIDICERLVKACGADIRFGGNVAAHAYTPEGHYITMPEPKTFKSVEAYYAVLMHELTHWVRWELGDKNSNGETGYSKEELVAEIGANFLLSYCGVDTSAIFDNSKAYIQGWIQKLGAEPKWIIQASSQAQKRFDWLMEKAGFATKPEAEEPEELQAAA